MLKYDNDSIRTVDGMQHIRMRISTYIPDMGMEGLYHCCKEILDNSIDECEIMGNAGMINIYMFKDRENSEYQIIVTDNGRGVPIDKVLSSFTIVNTSGKFNTDSYKFSAGLNGVGSKVVVATSKYTRVVTAVDNLVGDTRTFSPTDIPTSIITTGNSTKRKGTTVLFSPSKEFFLEISDFIQDHSRLTTYLQQLSLFAEYDIQMHVFDIGLEEEQLNADTREFIDFVDSLSKYEPVFDSRDFNKDEYMKEFFGTMRNFDRTYHKTYKSKKGNLLIDNSLSVMLTSNVHSNVLTFINNIAFTDKNSFQYFDLVKYLKSKLSHYIDNVAIANYFKRNYPMPIWLLSNIKFSGATFTGMEKHTFRDLKFRASYRLALKSMFNDDDIHDLYKLLAEHIEAGYNRFSNKHLKVSGSKSLLTQLNRPTKFIDCRTLNRETTELFLVEGDSAKSDKGRDPEHQAIYTLSGKPLNGITSKANVSKSAELLKANLIFQDIVKILNVQDGTLDKLYFDKLFMTTDADAHGYHIANIVLGDLYALCPKFIEEGHVYVVMPPHYRISLKGNRKLFARDSTELGGVLAKYVYFKFLEVRMKSSEYNRTLSCEEFMAFSEIVERIGDTITRVGEANFINPVILEQLALMTSHVDLENPDIEVMSKWFNQDVKYNREMNVLTISVGTNDMVIPLIKIKNIIYKHVLPLYRSFYYNRTTIFVTSKQDKMMRDQSVSLVQLYQLFQQLKSTLKISPLKGLGNMSREEIYTTCVNPDTRRSYQISSLGDVDTIFKLMGNDSKWRKNLVTSNYENLN